MKAKKPGGEKMELNGRLHVEFSERIQQIGS